MVVMAFYLALSVAALGHAALGHGQVDGRWNDVPFTLPQPQPQPQPHLGPGASTGRALLQAATCPATHPELASYIEGMARQPTVDCATAVRSQSLPTTAELGLQPMDAMKDLRTLPARLAFLNHLHQQVCTNASGRPGLGTLVRVSAYTMWSGDLWGLRRTLVPFMQWHLQLGVCRFYMAYPGHDGRTVAALQQLSAVRLIFTQPPFSSLEEFARWQRFLDTHEWAKRPGNWRQMIKQTYAGNIALVMARDERYQWMMHVDADELLVPGRSLAADLASVPSWAGSMTVLNNEALIEAVDTINKYEQVSLFKTHSKFAPKGASDMQWPLRLGTHNSFYQVYYNGKGIARTDRSGMDIWGVHGFLGPDSDDWKDPVMNPTGKFLTYESSSAQLLHLSYTNWHDLVGKAARACPPAIREAAAAGNMTMVSECFCLNFDRDAYMAALRGPEAAKEFWVTNSLFSEGAVQAEGQGCRVHRNVTALLELMIRDKLLVRINVVQQTLRAQEVAIRQMAAGMGIDVAAAVAQAEPAPLTTTVRRRLQRRQRRRRRL